MWELDSDPDDVSYEEDYSQGYQGFEYWKAGYIDKGLKKWGRGVCWSWCEHGKCDDPTGCKMVHPMLQVEPLGGGKGCSIQIKPSEHRLPNIERMLKMLGFVEQEEDDEDQEPLLFASDAILNTPYAEKDAAKSLGAWWNSVDKVWYVPPGTDVRPFAKWCPKVEGNYVAVMAYDSDAYLSCSFGEKDEAKSLGAFWDGGRKKWYVPRGKNLRPFLKWNPEVNGRSVVTHSVSSPLFVKTDLDAASALAALQDIGFDYSVFKFTWRKRLREEMRAAGYTDDDDDDDDDVKPPAAKTDASSSVKRPRCSSPQPSRKSGKDESAEMDRKLSAIVVSPEKSNSQM